MAKRAYELMAKDGLNAEEAARILKVSLGRCSEACRRRGSTMK
jgi:hypothetical protein